LEPAKELPTKYSRFYGATAHPHIMKFARETRRSTIYIRTGSSLPFEYTKVVADGFIGSFVQVEGLQMNGKKEILF